VVSLKPGHDVDPDGIKSFVKERMAAYKYPRVVEIVDELPKTTSGKIMRRLLKTAVANAAMNGATASVQPLRAAS